MILIITNARDITADYVILELHRRGTNTVRLNTEDFPRTEVSYDPSQGSDAWTIRLRGNLLDLRDVNAVYYRRPGAPSAPWVRDSGLRRYCETEWANCLKSIMGALEGRFLNSPNNIMLAEDKPRQLALAHTLGFRVPLSYIGNYTGDFNSRDKSRRWIIKALRESVIEHAGNECVAFTSELPKQDSYTPGSIRASPLILQNKLSKAFDIRVTVVEDTVFATEIHSQRYPETSVDWRIGSRLDIPHERHSLPPRMRNKCREIVKRLGLLYGAIDLLLDGKGQYWFLEINPNGQWAWLENRTGARISKSICDSLEEMAKNRVGSIR